MKLLMESWRHYLAEDEKKSKEEEEYEPHMMYDPETGEGKKAEKYEDHTKLKEKGWDHEKPDLDEAAEKGLWANIHAKRKSGEKPAKPGDKEYPETLNIDEADALEEGKKNCGCGKDPCITYGIQEGKDVRDKFGSEVPNRSKASRKRGMKALGLAEGEYHYVDAADINEEYCPECAQMEEAKEKKACKPSKGKRFAKRVDGKCRSYGQAGQAKGGGDRIRPGTKKGDAYCARSAGIKKCKNPPCANTLSRKKWKCRGKKSMKS
jgi:hypothetical protein